MVAISLYRGNLHRVPDVPRRWLMPNPTISLKDFRKLLARRSQALSRSTSSDPSSGIKPSTIPERHPNPDCVVPASLELSLSTGNGGQDETNVEPGFAIVSGKSLCDGDDPMAEEEREESNAGKEDESSKIGVKSPTLEEKELKGLAKQQPVLIGEEPSFDQSEQEKKKVEEKLQILREQKHNLVQVLKQILSVEEQLKPKLVYAVRSSAQLQVDMVIDSGSLSRQATPRLGLEPTVAVDTEAGDAEDACIHNIHSRHVNRTSSLSPSSESPARRHFLQSVVAHPSPSRFASTGFQGIPGNPPSISLSGTNYIASSPSPAASGGTSAFRDARHPSPWS